MRSLTKQETGQVHGGNAFTEWLGELWDDVTGIFGSDEEAEDFAQAMQELNDAIINGETTPEDACALLGVLCQQVAPTIVDPVAPSTNGALYAQASNYIQLAIAERERLMEEAGASYDTGDFQAEEYFSDSGWLDDVMASWNESCIDQFWDNYNDNAYVEIEIIDYCH